MSPSELAEVCKELANYLSKGWVHSSTSLFGAPILCVCKKDGGLCMYIDYRAFNKYMKLETYQLPRIDDLLDKLTHAHYLSIINLIIGYH